MRIKGALAAATTTVLLAGCGSAASAGPEDAAACAEHDAITERAVAGTITDEQLHDQIHAAWLLAGSDRLDGLMDDMLYLLDDRQAAEADGLDFDRQIQHILDWCR